MQRVVCMSLLLLIVVGLAVAPATADVFYFFTWSGGDKGAIAGGGPYTGTGIGIDHLKVFDTLSSNT